MPTFSLAENLASITDLQDEHFVVAEYQRGYRWKGGERGEVIQLLRDVERFERRGERDFYCLQPLVVSPRPNAPGKWELIDGQQRLTTIFLILAFLQRDTFELSYLTRHGSSSFLRRIRAGEIEPLMAWEQHAARYPNEDHIDNSHFFVAWQSIAAWFQEPARTTPDARENFATKLCEQTGVIWYETPDPDHKRVFLNLNSGKISLTNAELVKALFLRSDRPAGSGAPLTYRQRAEIATEWDRIESQLQSPVFWYFLTTDDPAAYSTRIDFLFRLLVPATTNVADELQVYRHYAELPALDVTREWQQLKACYLTLLEWYGDRALYHNIGFLTACGVRIAALYHESHRLTKMAFAAWVDGQVKRQVSGFDLKTMRYGADTARLRRVLMLFNIRMVASNPNADYFPFHRCRDTAWSLEHIHAQNSEALPKGEEWKDWVQDATAELTRPDSQAESRPLVAELAASLELADDTPETEDKRAALEARVFEFFGPDFAEGEMHRVDNLALLGKEMNSALSNNLFPVKRSQIIAWDRKGSFIPPATKNVFLKYYGGEVSRMNKWTKPDRDSYMAEIEKTLAAYLKSS